MEGETVFGYVKPHNPELLVKEYELYRAAYCGVCKAMQKYTGRLSAVALTYDVVFLAIVRGILTDEKLDTKRENCILHPLKKRNIVCETPSFNYCARVSALLSYWKLRDDSRDGGVWTKIKNIMPLLVMKRALKKADLSALGESVKSHMTDLAKKERARTPSSDECADIFGRLLGDVFAYEIDDALRDIAYGIGMHLGRFIYIADALDDYSDDARSGSYNPFVELYGRDGLSPEQRESITLALKCEISTIASFVERLSFDGRASEENIIKNTVYFGLERAIPQERCINEKPV